ncbi:MULTISPECIES: hypothetical protein [unclassified Microbacterium]|uniref:hypothetical protein n=1 Tax=unclassified Microbacterium TaxID=2609290 RepID=UPI0034180A3A
MSKTQGEETIEGGISPQADALIRFAIENPDQFKVIAEVAASRSSEALERRRTAAYADLLTARYNELTERHAFVPGQFVQWKPNLRNKIRPAYGEPAVVIELLEEPALNEEKDTSSPYFREPIDLALGVVDDEGEILIYHFDSRRFAPWPTVAD